IDSLLKGYQGVVTAKTGHINVHEAGAIEAYGHKVLALEQSEGKLEAKAITAFLDAFHADPTKEHMVEPGMVCISHPTEYGTLYTAAELEAISAACRRGRIPLYLDGARLGYGLSAQGTDVTLRM